MSVTIDMTGSRNLMGHLSMGGFAVTNAFSGREAPASCAVRRVCAGFAIVWAVALTGVCKAADGGYVVDEGGVVRIPEGGHESVLVQPGGSGSFDTAVGVGDGTDWSQSAVSDGYFQAPAHASCDVPGCVSCDGYGACATDDCESGFINRRLGHVHPRVVVQVDALMLWQGNIQGQLLMANSEGVLDVNDAQTPMSIGPRVGVFVNVDQYHAIEGNYFNVGSFNGEHLAFGGDNYIPAPGLPVTLPDSTVLGAVESSGRIQSAELNWRRRDCNHPLTWLAGFRWVQWNQDFLFAATDFATASGIVSETGNDLYGGQIGADLGLWNSGGRFTVNGIGKAGLFYNQAYQRSASFEDDALLSLSDGAEDGMAFFGEVGINASLALTRWLSWRAGYSFFWLSGVAVPSNQFDTLDGGDSLNRSGSVLLHGVTTGLEARW
jgi:hypothetical protein